MVSRQCQLFQLVSARYFAGELFNVLDTDKRLPEKIVKDIARQLVQALWYLHTRRIIHRDMKPQVQCSCRDVPV